MALRTRNILSLCAGVGGLELGIQLALLYRGEAGRGVCYVEREVAAAASLVASMEAGWFHPAPVWSDMRTFDARPWRGAVHILASGDPCQDNSVAGRRAGADGERFLAAEVTRVAEECRPDVVFRENVPGNAHEQLAAIAPPLEGMGYRVAAGIFSASGTGNTMRRERLFIMAVRDGGATAGEQVCVGQCCRPSDAGYCSARMDGSAGAEWRPIDGACRTGGSNALPQRQKGPDGAGKPSPKLVQPEGFRPGEGRAEHAGQQGRRAAAGAGSSMAGSGLGQQQVGEGDDGLIEQRPPLGRGAEQPAGSGAGGTDSHGRYPGGDGRDRSSVRDGIIDDVRSDVDRAYGIGRWAEGDQRGASEDALQPGRRLPPAVIPGPTDSRWIDVLDRFPELQPALSEEEAQSHLRRGVDAVAYRVERLRATGNGVDPVTAATAFLQLYRKLSE